MKRNARRAVLIAVLAAGAGFVQAAPAAAEDVCAIVYVNGLPAGTCAPTPVQTTCTGQMVNGTGYFVCVPLP